MERLAGKVILLSGARRAAVAFLAGLFGVLALPPFGFFACLFVSFTLLVWLIDGATADPEAGFLGRLAPSFWVGWFFGFGYFLGGLWWLGNALLVEADEFAWALPLAVLGLPAFLALYYGLAAAFARLLWSDGVGRIAALALGFCLAEWLRGTLFTGFPWNAVAYGAMPFPLLMQSVKLIGIDGINLLAVFVFAMPALLGTGKGVRLGMPIAAFLLIGHVGYGIYSLYFVPSPPASGPVIRLVQPVIDQAMKLDDKARTEIFEKHLTLTAAAPAAGQKRPDIIVWPETSIPFILTDNPDALQRIADVLEDEQVLVAGAVRTESTGAGKAPRYYNSIYVIDGKGQITGAADKVHLVPFGEYMPFGEIFRSWGIDAVAAMPGGFSGGPSHQLLTLPNGRSFYPLICYEAIFPTEIANSVTGVDALLNVTNDGWFGNTPGPYQHFQQAQVTAVAKQVPMIRGANNGISAIVDAKGQVILGMPYNSNGFIDATITGKNVTFHDKLSQNLWFWFCVSMVFVLALFSRAGFIFGRN